MTNDDNGRSTSDSCTSSGIEVDTEEGRKPITQVIDVRALEGDNVRAALMRAIRGAVMEAKKAREAAKQYCIREGFPAQAQ